MKNAFKSLIFIAAALATAACSSGSSSSSATCTAADVAYPALGVPYTAALTGCTIIDYSVPLTIGSTAGTMSVLFDSGSTTLAVAGASCTGGDGCSGISPRYTPSGSAVNTSQTTDSLYGDNTYWSGTVYQDNMSVAGIPSIKSSFANITEASTSPAYFNDSDCSYGTTTANTTQGIMGFGGSGLIVGSTVGYLDALNGSTQNFPAIFAIQMCMTGGNVWFGGYDSTYTSGAPVVYTPITSCNSYFNFNIEEMQIGSTSVSAGIAFNDGIIADTGTSIAILPTNMFNNIVSTLGGNSTFTTQLGNASNFFNGNNATPCLQAATMTQAQIDSSLPSVVLTLPSTTAGSSPVTVTLPASRSYLDAHTVSGHLEYCPGIAPDGGFGPDILGGSFMRSQVVIFDRTNNQIGFAPQNALNSGAKSCVN